MGRTLVLVCPKCGSRDRRPGNKGCAECHRRDTRARNRRYPGLSVDESRLFTRLLADDFTDITVTRPMSAYLEAFTAYLLASKIGDVKARRQAKRWRRRLLNVIEGPLPSGRGPGLHEAADALGDQGGVGEQPDELAAA